MENWIETKTRTHFNVPILVTRSKWKLGSYGYLYGKESGDR